ETFIHLTRDPELAQSLDIPVNTLEGYLFPETYHFSRYTSERKIIQTMLDTFVQRAARPKHLKRAEELNMSFHEIVTLASLIE
ncbi:MAG: aminodeoxychorismate lyase, partial [Nitrospinaceae bacterium]|nr:aminodeoxychorismate lyase [Nitrospinaceae bacterium]NIR53686.1 aminodeoxychorismate lyase [Nitrospinaceae bacterium]NIS84097.1 aminodeoxychorismate lyase [Nitrospinaceae bacterium]NIT80897.1 aminodeoxychorismate lyase [Nitrospinaceae bacterium]NIU43196.1 aminodeoxychorismate lyase [Nitrospinaceae bacterium]